MTNIKELFKDLIELTKLHRKLNQAVDDRIKLLEKKIDEEQHGRPVIRIHN